MYRRLRSYVTPLLVATFAATGCGKPWTKANPYLNDGRFVESVEILQREIADEDDDIYEEKDDAAFGALRRVLAIRAMAGFVRKHSRPEDFDGRLARYYQECQKLLDAAFPEPTEADAKLDRSLRGLVELEAGLYFAASGRARQALTHYDAAQKRWGADAPAAQSIVVENSMAEAYDDLGELELRDRSRKLALEHGRSRLEAAKREPLKKTPDPNPQEGAAKRRRPVADAADEEDPSVLWAAHAVTMLGRMKDLAEAGRVAEAARIARDAMKMAEDHGFVVSYQASFDAATSLAEAGETKTALEFLRAGYRQLSLAVFEPELRESERAKYCTTALVLAKHGAGSDALTAAEQCLKLDAQVKKSDFGKAHYAAAVANEAAGHLDVAERLYAASIEASEARRRWVPVTERASLFRSLVRRRYEGLVRTAAKRFAEAPNGAFVEQSLAAAERFRARQLVESLDAQGPLPGQMSLQTTRAALGPDTGLLYTTVTRDGIVVATVTDGHAEVRFSPIPRAQLSERLGRLTRALADPSSPSASIDAELEWLATVLVSPSASDALLRKPTLLVVPDGPLNGVPFELLPVGGVPLLSRVTTMRTPSLAFFARALKPRGPMPRQFFAMGDPNHAPAPSAARSGGQRGLAKVGDVAPYLQPLPETRAEVGRIASLFPASGVSTFFGADANEAVVTGGRSFNHRYLHFATHGLLGGEVPGLVEPALVLSATPGGDGYLTASEVSRLTLNSELAVLSACNTGVGQYYSGEGIMGMGRAFLVAGSRSVLVSLWSVESNATVELMVELYRNLDRGLPAAHALREAKRTMAAQAGRGHPYFWSGFTLLGSPFELAVPATTAPPPSPPPVEERR